MSLSGPDFEALSSLIQSTANSHGTLEPPIFHAKLFEDDESSVYQVWRDHLPEDLRQEHNCRACQHFLNTYGDLCVVDKDNGSLIPLFWPRTTEKVPEVYKKSIEALYSLFKDRTVRKEYRVLDPSRRDLGREVTTNTQWTHFHVRLLNSPLNPEASGDLDLAIGFEMLSRVLRDNDLKTVNKAHHLMHEKLPYATSHRPALDWLQKAITHLESDKVVNKTNLVYWYSRKAWVGCISSLRSGIIGEFLSWVNEDMEYADLERKWSALADPIAYLRPTAAPSEGQLEVAEKLLKDLGYTKEDLMRYYLATDEMPSSAILWKDEKLWKGEKEEVKEDAEIFKALREKLEKEATLKDEIPTSDPTTPPTPISFRRFVKTVLPIATTVEIKLENAERMAFFTRGAPGSKSPFVFDSLNPENTMSWYFWANARSVGTVKLKSGWNRVNAITTFPHMWDYLTTLEALEWQESKPKTEEEGGKPAWIHSRHGTVFLLCIEGIEEEHAQGLCLFPTFLKNVFHGIRKTMEAYSDQETIEWPHSPSDGKAYVGGEAASRDNWNEKTVRVTTGHGIVSTYKITLFE